MLNGLFTNLEEGNALSRLMNTRRERDDSYGFLSESPPEMHQMGFDKTNQWATGITALLALTGNAEAAGAGLSGFLGGRQQSFDQSNQQSLQNFDLKQRQGANKARVADMKVGDAEQDLGRVYQRKDRAAADQDRKARLEIMAEDKKRLGIEGVTRAYNSAKGLDNMKAVAARWRALDPDNAPDDLQVAEDFSTRQAGNKARAMQLWESALKNELNEFGEVPEGRAKSLETMRQAIAKDSGVELETLRTVPTGATLKKQRQAELKREFDEKLKFTKAQHKDNLAIKKANVAIAKERVQVAWENAITMRGALQMNQYRGILQAYNIGVKGLNSEADATIRDINQKLAGAKAQLRGIDKESQAEEYAKVKARIDQLEGEKAYVQSQYEEELEIPDFFGGGTIQNPNYTGPAPQQPPVPQAPQVPGPITGTPPYNPFQGQISPVPGATAQGASVVQPSGQPRPKAITRQEFERLRKGAEDAIRKGVPPAEAWARFRKLTGGK